MLVNQVAYACIHVDVYLYAEIIQNVTVCRTQNSMTGPCFQVTLSVVSFGLSNTSWVRLNWQAREHSLLISAHPNWTDDMRWSTIEGMIQATNGLKNWSFPYDYFQACLAQWLATVGSCQSSCRSRTLSDHRASFCASNDGEAGAKHCPACKQSDCGCTVRVTANTSWTSALQPKL